MAGYLGAIPVPQATQNRESFTCSANQTSFATAGYTQNFVDAFLNGVRLNTADFTATNGSDIVLASGAAENDVLDVISYATFEVNAQTFTGTTTLTDVVAATLDISGNIDIDGITNLDVVDIDGAVNIAAATTIATNNKIQFRDTAIYLNSSADGQLDIVADTEIQIAATTIDINGAVALNGAITGATNITLSGELDAATGDFSGAVDIAGQVTVADGSAGAPSISNTGDVNTGMFFPSADSLAISTSGTQRLTIDASGRVMINTTSAGVSGAKEFTVASTDSGSAGITIRAGTTSSSSIYMSDATSGAGEYAGYIAYAHNSNTMSLATSSAPRLNIDSTGAVTMPAQPAFQGQATTLNNITSDGVKQTIPFTEIFDQNADFASNTFTAPVTGKYQLNVHILLENADSAATYYQLQLQTSNRIYYETVDADYGQDSAYLVVQTSVLADMDASDTAIVKILQSGGSTQTDINTTTSKFSGFLAC